MTEVTIFHNPACSKSRAALAAIRAAGREPRVVEYLKTPPSRAEVQALLAAAGLAPRQAMRTKDELYKSLGLGDAALSDDQLLDAIARHPALLERPFVVTPRGTRLCRPAERLDEIFP